MRTVFVVVVFLSTLCSEAQPISHKMGSTSKPTTIEYACELISESSMRCSFDMFYVSRQEEQRVSTVVKDILSRPKEEVEKACSKEARKEVESNSSSEYSKQAVLKVLDLIRVACDCPDESCRKKKLTQAIEYRMRTCVIGRKSFTAILQKTDLNQWRGTRQKNYDCDSDLAITLDGEPGKDYFTTIKLVRPPDSKSLTCVPEASTQLFDWLAGDTFDLSKFCPTDRFEFVFF